MKTEEYEKAKQECWTKFVYHNRERIAGESTNGSLVFASYADAFDNAYNLGMEAAKKEMLTANVDSSQPNVESLEEKKTEPKFDIGAKVKCQGNIYKVAEIRRSYEQGYYYIVKSVLTGQGYQVFESDLEPYTEPQKIASEESHLCNLSQNIANCDKDFDNILKDSFRSERRLNIAAMAMQGILSNESEVSRACQSIVDSVKVHSTPEAIALYALACADALIEESQKGSNK